MIMETLIKIRGVTKTFRMAGAAIAALRGIDLDIYRGEYLSIMGPSGSGKSTLFNMIGALDLPTSGTIEISGHELTRLSPPELAYFRGNHIGYVFQTYNLIPAYRAIDNVAMPLLFSGQPYEKAVERAREVLSQVGLGHRVDHRPDELSGGQQQRVAIARALANHPAIILADEPTGNLDLATGEEIIHLLNDLTRRFGVTVVTATHDHKMLSASDRILWIRDGAVERLEERQNLNIQIGKIE